MPVYCDWYDEAHAVIHLCFIGNWTTQEMWDTDKNLVRLSRQASGRFDIISDTTQASYTPPVGVLWEWQQMAEIRHTEFPNWGLTVYVADSRVLQAYFTEASQTSIAIRQHGRLAKTLEEAIKIIQADRAKHISAYGD